MTNNVLYIHGVKIIILIIPNKNWVGDVEEQFVHVSFIRPGEIRSN